MVSTPRLLTSLALALLPALAPAPIDPVPGEPDIGPVRFDRDVQPILSDHCWTCHGPDSAAREADLRLDLEQGALGDRRGGPVVIPGNPGGSTLLARVTSDDPFERMPPGDPEDGLSADQVETLRRWIAEGATWQRHWAFVAPEDGPPPMVSDPGWLRDPIDAHVLAGLEQAGLSPSPEADRATLLRRVTVDLTGLPPSVEELDAFLADERPDAYEQVVERLLASEHHGERLAVEWLDASRYADTNGYHHDDFRTMWPWRDWVVRAFNENKPFDTFVVEQMAGDLLPEPTTDQLIATGFHRNHGITAEGGALDAEYLVEYAADRVATTSTVFLGLTMECARCHEHKYDPISQEEYYGLFAYFNSIDERGVPAFVSGRTHAFEPTLPAPSDEQTAALAELDGRLEAVRAQRDAPDPEAESQFRAWHAARGQAAGLRWEAPAPVAVSAREEATELTVLDDGSVLVGGEHPGTDVHTLRYRSESSDLRVLRFDALHHESLPTDGVGRAFHGNAVVSALTLEAVSLADPERREVVPFRWAWADHSQDNGDFAVQNLLAGTGDGWAVAGHTHPGPRTALLLAERPFGFEGGTELVVTVHYESRYMQHLLGRVAIAFGGGAGDPAPATLPLVSGPWWQAGPFAARSATQAFESLFGPELVSSLDRQATFGVEAQGWSIRPALRDGDLHELSGERSAFFLARELWTPVDRRLELSLGSDDALEVFLDGVSIHANDTRRGLAPDQDQVALELPAGRHLLVAKVVNDGGPGGFTHTARALDELVAFAEQPLAVLDPASLHEPHAEALRDAWRRSSSPAYLALTEQLAGLEAERATLEDEIPLTMILREREERRPTHVLNRGAYDDPDESRPVARGVPAALGALPDGARDDRLGLARWLVADDQPLVARVAVNRFWQMLFGTGLVATQEDFGSRGAWPSHPALLDHLAVSFRESGWDVRQLLRRVVTSSTYRQAARERPDAAAADPDNRLLWRGPRRRLSAEQIRDQALAVAGVLSPRLGGPAVKPYQPDGLWAERAIPGSNTKLFERDSGEALYRRSLYTFWKRSAPPPQMATFDAPEREFCVVRRGRTNTPLQALVLMNDEAFVELARLAAARVLGEADDEDQRLDRLVRRATGRTPGADERALLAEALSAFRERFAAAPDDAAALLALGESMPDPRWPADELAAWTVVASTVLNLHETITLD